MTDQQLDTILMNLEQLPNDFWRAEIRQLVDDYRELRERQDWRPIETAPKNGDIIWLGATRRQRLGFWGDPHDHSEDPQANGSRWIDLAQSEQPDSLRGLRFLPTAWCPLTLKTNLMKS